MALAIESVRPKSIPLPLFERLAPSPGFSQRRERVASRVSHPNVVKSVDYENKSVHSLDQVFDEDAELIEEHEIREALSKRKLYGLAIPDGVRFKVLKSDGKIKLKLTDLIEAQYEGSLAAERKLKVLFKLRKELVKDPEIFREAFISRSQEYQDADIEISEPEESYVIFIAPREKEPDPEVIQNTPFNVILTQIPEAA